MASLSRLLFRLGMAALLLATAASCVVVAPGPSRGQAPSTAGLRRQADSGQERPANATAAEAEASPAVPRPFYAIAHRVLMDYGVRAALDHGANAIEVDMYAWRDAWYADHNGFPTSKGHSARHMFQTIAAEHRAGRKVAFVWLDIKNPDYCGRSQPRCNIEALRDLARQLLLPAGVGVLYGFYGDKAQALPLLRANLTAGEAINIDGPVAKVLAAFRSSATPPRQQRVMSRGLFFPRLTFGSCRGSGPGICPDLRRAAASAELGQVYGWTVSRWTRPQAWAMMAEADVDGLIYGFPATHYYDHPDVRRSLAYLTQWLADHPTRRYLAAGDLPPW